MPIHETPDCEAIEFIDDEKPSTQADLKPWRILIVDDDADVHDATLVALNGELILDHPLMFQHAYSGRECLEHLRQCPDVAVIMLDVVMETPNAGLDVINRIRSELGLHQPRIILHTGQPGYAPELDTIRRYDINDYKTKGRLTRYELYTALTAAIRAYEQICRLDASRRGLAHIVKASNQFIAQNSLASFGQCAIERFAEFVGVEAEGAMCVRPANATLQHGILFAASGQLAALTGQHLDERADSPLLQSLVKALQDKTSQLDAAPLVLYLQGSDSGAYALALPNVPRAQDIDQELLDVLRTNMAICADNIRLMEERNAQLGVARGQLIQAEKMASIGQLAAGVAHEINNPIGFVHANLGALEAYFTNLLDLLAAYEQAEPNAESAGHREHIESIRRRIDIDYVRNDLPQLIKESRDGIARVRQIIKDLRDFAQVDTRPNWQVANLHAGLDATINLISGQMRNLAVFEREYGTLPLVECLPSQLNQVFLNLLMNAGQAMTDQPGRIVIRTGTEQESVWLEFSDDGCGIPNELQQKIFEPFFTTRPVGSGAGLGLALAYGIVRAHKGSITVESQVGRGSRFRISLPIKQAARQAGH